MEPKVPFENKEHSDVELYAGEGIGSRDAPVPRWLKFNYIFWPLWGIVWFFLFWNGSTGWFDRGYWNQLQRAANTTFPFNTTEVVERAVQVERDRQHK